MAPAGSRGDRDTALGPVPFETVPLSAVFGAEIRGLDLSAAADDAVLAWRTLTLAMTPLTSPQL